MSSAQPLRLYSVQSFARPHISTTRRRLASERRRRLFVRAGGRLRTGVGRLSVGDEFDEQHAVRPDVRLGAELAVAHRLERRPLDRKLGT